MTHPLILRAWRSRLVRHSGWNVLGFVVPLLVGLVSIPILLKTIGDSRFGFLSIAWMLIGYFGVLDLGIGRALTHAVSRRLAHGEGDDVAEMTSTGLSLLGILSIVSGLVLAVATPWIVRSLMDVPLGLQGEALYAMWILSAAVPFVLLSAGFRAILEARQEFKAINLIQAPLGVLLYAVPLVIIQFSVSLEHVILGLAVVRLLNCAALAIQTRRVMPRVFSAGFRGELARELMSFGGWMTVTNVVSPMMVNMDRLFISSRLALASVTYYVTPFEVMTKMLVVPSAVAGAAFPQFSRLAHLGSTQDARRFLLRCVAFVLALTVPPAIIAAVLAHPLLSWWVSAELANQSAPIMRILALGVVINGVSYVPFAYIQGNGRSDLTAKFHVLELAVYVPTLLLMISWLGLVGVAWAWVIRVALDAVLLFGAAFRGFSIHREDLPAAEPAGAD